jgi:hypothetical protein
MRFIHVGEGGQISDGPTLRGGFVSQDTFSMYDNVAGSMHPSVLPTVVFRTLSEICNIVVPADEVSGSASDAGVPQFLDYVASQSKTYYQSFVSFVMWLNAYCDKCYGLPFLECLSAQQEEVMNQISYRRNADFAPELPAGIETFRSIRRDILNAFFTSRIGIEDLGFRGNQIVEEFTGCPIDMTPFIEEAKARYIASETKES